MSWSGVLVLERKKSKLFFAVTKWLWCTRLEQLTGQQRTTYWSTYRQFNKRILKVLVEYTTVPQSKSSIQLCSFGIFCFWNEMVFVDCSCCP